MPSSGPQAAAARAAKLASTANYRRSRAESPISATTSFDSAAEAGGSVSTAGSTTRTPLLQDGSGNDGYASNQIRMKRQKSNNGLKQRAIQNDGVVVNNPSTMWDDIPTWLVQRSTPTFMFLVAASYLLIAVLFAALYMHDIKNCVSQTDITPDGVVTVPSTSFTDALFFSVQTLSTVGYGSRSPTCSYAEVISAAQCFSGLIYIAIVTGLLFGRFTRPLSRLLLSECVCVGLSEEAADGGDNARPTKVKRLVEFRIANGHKIPAVCVAPTMIFSSLDHRSGTRQFKKLRLKEDDSPGWLAHVQTITHVVDDRSPLHKVTEEDFIADGGMIHVTVSAMNGVMLAPMMVSGTYGPNIHGATGLDGEKRVIFGSRLAPLTTPSEDGVKLVYDYAKLSTYSIVGDFTEEP